jgi:hypothetical protein
MTGTHPAVDWALDLVGPVAETVAGEYTLADDLDNDPVQVRRVDRDNSQIYDGSDTVDMSEPIHKRKAQLKTGAFVSVSFANQVGDLTGTEPLLDTDVVVNVRIEGMHCREYGHIDPIGVDGIPFKNGEDGLVDRVRDAIWADLQYPDVGDPRVSYRHLQIDDDPQSAGWSDFYRHELDVTLTGYENIGQ